MQLYTKTILIISLTFLAVMLVLLIGFEAVVLESYSTLESEHADRDLARAANAITEKIKRLEEKAADYGNWDETYDYVVTQNPAFATSNLIPATIETLDVSSLLIFRSDGSYLAGVTAGEGNLTEDEMLAIVESNGLNTQKAQVSGIIGHHDIPILVATHPVLTSRHTGPERGTLIFLEVLTDEKISDLSEMLLQNLSFTRSPLAGIPSLVQNNGTSASPLPDSFHRSGIFPSISGSEQFVLTIEETREIWERGISSRNFLLLALLILMICFLGVAISLINLVVITPLRDINSGLQAIGRSGLLSGRLPAGRDDEIGEISETINRMLTQLEREEKERTASERRFRDLIELAEEGICVITYDGVIQFANPKMTEIWKIAPETLIGMNLGYLLIPDEKNPSLLSQLEDFSEFRTRTPDGIELYLKVTIAEFTLEIGEPGWLCIITDVSAIHRTMQALELSNRKLSLLGSMTRHDIVNQLTTIRGMISLAIGKNQDEKIKPLLNAASEAAEKINKHIEFSKEYQKAGIEAPSWQNLRAICHLAWAMARKKGVTFSIEGKNYEIFADALLQNAFFNLIDNSLKHGIGVFTITIRTRQDGDELVILYEDDGEGIPNEMKEKVFERGIGSGTGWGLFLIREILAFTGITIVEKGTYGIGVLFELRVPFEGFRPAPAESPPEEFESGQSESGTEPERQPGDDEHED